MRTKAMLAAAVVIVMAAVAGAGVQNARAVLPPGNTAEQWDKIAEDTVVGSGAFQNEGLIYMAYASNAGSPRRCGALRPRRALAPTSRRATASRPTSRQRSTSAASSCSGPVRRFGCGPRRTRSSSRRAARRPPRRLWTASVHSADR